MLSLIDYFRHKGFFFCSFSNRKRITKATYCKDESYKRAGGRAAAWEGKNYADQARISYFARVGWGADVAGLVPGVVLSCHDQPLKGHSISKDVRYR